MYTTKRTLRGKRGEFGCVWARDAYLDLEGELRSAVKEVGHLLEVRLLEPTGRQGRGANAHTT